MRTVILLILSIIAVPVDAASVTSGVTHILDIYFYGVVREGGVIFETASLPATCNGFWISREHPGFETVVSSILMAFNGNHDVRVSADDQITYSTSAGTFCAVNFLHLAE